MRIKLSLSNPEVKKILKATYPNYRGRKIYYSPDLPLGELRSYWDSGYRDYWTFYQPQTGKTWALGSNHPFFERGKPAPVIDRNTFPESVCLVCHSYAGVNEYITIYAKAPIAIDR